MIVKELNQKANKVDFSLGNNLSGGRSFFVRFYDKELEDDFLKTFSALIGSGAQMEKKLTYGTYAVIELGKTTYERDWSAWDILMHKYSAFSKKVYRESLTGKRYYPILFSLDYIEPCEKRFVS